MSRTDTALLEAPERTGFTPTLPSVDLLPSSVGVAFAARRVRRWVIAVGVVLLLAIGGIWYSQSAQVADARTGLEAAEADNASWQAKLDALGPVSRMYQQITGEKEFVQTTLAAQPRAAEVIASLLGAGASLGNVTFDTMQVEYRAVPRPGDELNSCPNPDPFSDAVTIGCVTFSGMAGSVAAISQLLSTIESSPAFVGPYVTSSTVVPPTEGDPGGVSFTGTVGVATDALAAPLTAEQLAEIRTAPSTEPSEE